MGILGVRCSNSDCHLAIIQGDQAAPVIKDTKRIKFPRGFSLAESLLWFYQEITDYLKGKKIESIAIRAPENNARRSRSLDTRLQFEAILFLLGAQLGITSIESKVKSTIAKDLGLKGKGKYLDTKLDTSIIDNFEEYSSKAKEAIMVAWSSLN